uniref:F-box domain-containing protein n=1 Tax=Caenorhabditis japonica TaxID=281687 RepID=A0A8R1IG51_CAEJA
MAPKICLLRLPLVVQTIIIQNMHHEDILSLSLCSYNGLKLAREYAKIMKMKMENGDITVESCGNVDLSFEIEKDGKYCQSFGWSWGDFSNYIFHDTDGDVQQRITINGIERKVGYAHECRWYVPTQNSKN